MAKPIRATPTLKGESADNLLENMLKTEKRRPNDIELELINDIIRLKD